MNLKEKIEKYYDVKFDDESFFLEFYLKGTNKRLSVNPFRNIYITYGKEIDRTLNETQLDELVDKGVIDKVSGMELYEMFTDLTLEDMYIKYKHYDLRTKNYFDAILRNIGFVEDTSSYDSIADRDDVVRICRLETRPNVMNYRDTEIVLYKSNDYYIVEKFAVYPPDDYSYIKVVFNQKPTLYDFKSWENVERAKIVLFNRGYKFTCWECGNKAHWLDVSGSLEEKIRCLEERYCGC